jgi:hypothetical protein
MCVCTHVCMCVCAFITAYAFSLPFSPSLSQICFFFSSSIIFPSFYFPNYPQLFRLFISFSFMLFLMPFYFLYFLVFIHSFFLSLSLYISLSRQYSWLFLYFLNLISLSLIICLFPRILSVKPADVSCCLWTFLRDSSKTSQTFRWPSPWVRRMCESPAPSHLSMSTSEGERDANTAELTGYYFRVVKLGPFTNTKQCLFPVCCHFY